VRNEYTILVGKLEEREHLEDLDVDNIKIYLKNIGFNGVDCIHLALLGSSVRFL
jgi:hypothetical protein